MSFELLGFILVVAGAIPWTLFVILYAWKGRQVWWAWPTGRAVMVASLSVALLLDMSLLLDVLSLPMWLAQTIAAVIIGGIAVGGWLKLGAILDVSKPKDPPR